MSATALAVVLALLTVPWLASGHGLLAFPLSRNYIAEYVVKPPDHYCAHCGQGQGGQPGVCGDPFQDGPPFSYFEDKGYYGIRTPDLVEGDVIEIALSMFTNHGGRMSFSVCPLPAAQATQACFYAPDHRMRRVDANPMYNNKLYQYLHPDDGFTITSRWRLPPGISCPNGCLFQWWWLAFQHCYVGCEGPEDDVMDECGTNLLNPTVGLCPNGISSTEQYINCADVRILPSDTPGAWQLWFVRSKASDDAVDYEHAHSQCPRGPSPSPSPSPEPSPSPSPSPSPTPSPSPSPSPSVPTKCPPRVMPWACQECEASTSSPAYTDLLGECYACIAARSSDPYYCQECFPTENPLQQEVVSSCLKCVGEFQQPGWSCHQRCAQFALDAGAMDECTHCLVAAPDGWGCGLCMSVAGSNPGARQACLTCVEGGHNSYGCGQCAMKEDNEARQACFTCLEALPDAETSLACFEDTPARQCDSNNQCSNTV